METRTVTVDDGTEIFVELHGSTGPVLVFVAGLGDNRLTWTAQVEMLANQFRIVLLDNRGAGNSSTPSGPYTMERMADDAHQVLSALGLGPVTAIGVSMGGAICQHWAAKYPDDVERMVLSSTWSAPDVAISALFDHWKGLAERNDRLALIESLLVFCFSADYLAEKPETVRAFIEGETMNLGGFAPAAVACREHDATAILGNIRQPVLVTIGEHDILIRPKLSHALARQLPNAEVIVMPTGHMPGWETPERYSELISTFASVTKAA